MAVIPLRGANQALLHDLAALTGGHASVGDADRVAYARDLWPRQQIRTRAGEAAVSPPAVVVWPGSTDEVSQVVRYAAERGIPLVPYGAGSGVCGGVSPTESAIVLDVKRMRALREVDETRLVATAEAGMIGQHLEDGLDERGFTLGHFPSSIYCSTLGGWVAGRSAGQCSGRYGKIEDMIVSVLCVDGQGEVRRAGEGGDPGLLPLIIGSEGILGVVTEASFHIAPAAMTRRFASFNFGTVAEGLAGIRSVYQAGLRPAVARLYDPFDSMLARQGGVKQARKERTPDPGGQPGLGLKVLTRALRHPGLLNRLIEGLPGRVTGGVMVIFVWEDDAIIGEAERAVATRICTTLGGTDTGEEPGRHWLSHRHSVSYRQSPLYAAGAFVDTMEVAATWSRLLPMYEAVLQALSNNVFVMAHFSHAYPDGASIYFSFAGSAKDDAACLELYDRTWRSALRTVIDAGGTLSHHHGVGRSKAPAMRREQGVAVDVVRVLSQELDPHHVLNPGALIGKAEVHS
ncbi:MAG: FAD-binding oxidoreductase [Myxococcales bacterium]|nr:FAD-binding oxidoreductase [Myxococcales bacterium]